jgi:hypothetical protein
MLLQRHSLGIWDLEFGTFNLGLCSDFDSQEVLIQIFLYFKIKNSINFAVLF